MDVPPPDTTYHLVPAPYYDSLDPAVDYQPEAMVQEGFIHCTDGYENLITVANRYYRQDPRAYYCLVIDRRAVQAPICYEDPERIYPHIYGALNRDAIRRVEPVDRLPSGTFVAGAG